MAAVVLNSDVRQHKRRPRINKHLTERRRRARINDSLTQIKNLVFPALENKVSQHSKVEKADILDMTLLYIRGLQRHSLSSQGSQQTGDHFAAGFSECLGEVSQFLLSCDTVDPDTRMQILNHLADRCRPVSGMPSPPSDRPSPANMPPSPVSTSPSPVSTPPSPASSLPSPSMEYSPTMTSRSTHSSIQSLGYAYPQTGNSLYVDVYDGRHGDSLTFVTPPNSPICASTPVPRNSVTPKQNARSRVETGTSHKSHVWQPWN